jgi:hypothetical protein
MSLNWDDINLTKLAKKVSDGTLEYSRSDLSLLLDLPYIKLAPLLSEMKFAGVLTESPRKPTKYFLIDKAKLDKFVKDNAWRKLSISDENVEVGD